MSNQSTIRLNCAKCGKSWEHPANRFALACKLCGERGWCLQEVEKTDPHPQNLKDTLIDHMQQMVNSPQQVDVDYGAHLLERLLEEEELRECDGGEEYD